MTAADEITLCRFSDAHLPGALCLSREAGWPHRAEDWVLTLAFSDGLVALRGDTVVSTTLCSLFGDVAMLNMIIVDSRLRRLGLARRMMERAMEAAAGREMRLVATPEGLPFYRKLGFTATGEIVQHQGVVPARICCGTDVRAGAAEDLPGVVCMDGAASGMARGPLLERIATTGRLFLTDGGFGMLRTFGRGHVIGPVVARDATAASALMTAAAATLAGGFLRVDMPAARAAECAGTLRTLGLAPVDSGTAMSRDARPRPIPPAHTFALASQALG